MRGLYLRQCNVLFAEVVEPAQICSTSGAHTAAAATGFVGQVTKGLPQGAELFGFLGGLQTAFSPAVAGEVATGGGVPLTPGGQRQDVAQPMAQGLAVPLAMCCTVSSGGILITRQARALVVLDLMP
jgi:hypothetical protein